MHWSAVPFGKHKGKTFPEIIVRDPDWFFWVLPKLYGKLGEEAQELARRARAIKPPRLGRSRLEVEYEFDVDRRFCGFQFVDADSPPSRWATRTYLYGPAVCCKPDVSDGGGWSCASVSGP